MERWRDGEMERGEKTMQGQTKARSMPPGEEKLLLLLENAGLVAIGLGLVPDRFVETRLPVPV